MVDTIGPGCSYELLKHIAMDNEPPSQRQLETLKDIFAREINSVRRRELIKTVAELIDCLERRDALSPENIEPLRELADHCGGQRLQDALCAYVTPKALSTTEPINQYRELRQRAATTDLTTVHTSVVVAPPVVMLTEKKRAAIRKVLSQEIGHYWRRLGRELDVGEGAMDELEEQFPRDVSSRVHRLLQLFEEDDCHDPKLILLDLCRALENCQRKDLRRKVENIMSH